MVLIDIILMGSGAEFLFSVFWIGSKVTPSEIVVVDILHYSCIHISTQANKDLETDSGFRIYLVHSCYRSLFEDGG